MRFADGTDETRQQNDGETNNVMDRKIQHRRRLYHQISNKEWSVRPYHIQQHFTYNSDRYPYPSWITTKHGSVLWYCRSRWVNEAYFTLHQTSQTVAKDLQTIIEGRGDSSGQLTNITNVRGWMNTRGDNPHITVHRSTSSSLHTVNNQNAGNSLRRPLMSPNKKKSYWVCRA